jgi:hypothetical protein
MNTYGTIPIVERWVGKRSLMSRKPGGGPRLSFGRSLLLLGLLVAIVLLAVHTGLVTRGESSGWKMGQEEEAAILNNINNNNNNNNNNDMVLFTGAFNVSFIRHAEKPIDPTNVHLNREGRARADALMSLFCGKAVGCRFDVPMLLFARKAERPRFVEREVETLTPLARKLNLSIEEVGINETTQLYESIMEFAGSSKVRAVPNLSQAPLVALICWEHHDFYHLFPKFGCATDPREGGNSGGSPICPHQILKWPDYEFNTVVTFSYVGMELYGVHTAPLLY